MDGSSQVFGSGLTYCSEMFAIELRNMEAMRLAMTKMLEGLGALGQRQAEMLEGTLRRSFSPLPGVPDTAPGLRMAIAGQIDRLKVAMAEAQANSNILSELVARNGGEVATILQSRLTAALDEVKAALTQAIPDALPLANVPAPAAVTMQPAAIA